MYQSISAVLIVAVTLLLSLYDILPALSAADGDTISAVLRQWSREWPILAWLWGVLGGHWFLGYSEPLMSAPDEYVLIWLTWCFFVLNVWVRAEGVRLGTVGYFVVLLFGIIAGHFLWSQAI